MLPRRVRLIRLAIPLASIGAQTAGILISLHFVTALWRIERLGIS
jgi:hypothetical protein